MYSYSKLVFLVSCVFTSLEYEVTATFSNADIVLPQVSNYGYKRTYFQPESLATPKFDSFRNSTQTRKKRLTYSSKKSDQLDYKAGESKIILREKKNARNVSIRPKRTNVRSNHSFSLVKNERIVNPTVESSNRVINEVVIEIQVFLDNILFQDIQAAVATGKVKDVQEYLLTFFKGVNTIYERSHPNEVYFTNITARVCSYVLLPPNVERGIFRGAEDDSSVHVVEHVLKYFRLFAKKYHNVFDKYDHNMLLTGRDLHRQIDDVYDSGVLGVAFLKGICTKSSSARFEAFSVVEDPGARFLGVYPAVHELTHNLGVKHDPKADAACNSNHGFIMSPSTLGTNNLYYFSSCSIDSIKFVLESDSSGCLGDKNLPSINSLTPESEIRHPGELYTMQEICDHLAHTAYPNEIDVTAAVNSYKHPSDLCKKISCKVKIGDRKFLLDLPLPPGEKTKCGYGGTCIEGQCIYVDS